MSQNSTIDSSIYRLQPKQFYRQIENIFQQISASRGAEHFARSFISLFFEQLSGPLTIRTVHLYETIDFMNLICTWGDYAPDLSEEMSALWEKGTEFPWIHKLRGQDVCVLPLSVDHSFLALFGMESQDRDLAELSSIYSALHYAIQLNLKLLELQDTLEQARAIQLSLLPDAQPGFPGYQIAAGTVPAKSVGGDVYDMHALSPKLLALALGDASGHGLPAALQSRDVITGLRMQWDPEMDLVHTVERLNGVIHRSGMGSRFVP